MMRRQQCDSLEHTNSVSAFEVRVPDLCYACKHFAIVWSSCSKPAAVILAAIAPYYCAVSCSGPPSHRLTCALPHNDVRSAVVLLRSDTSRAHGLDLCSRRQTAQGQRHADGMQHR